MKNQRLTPAFRRPQEMFYFRPKEDPAAGLAGKEGVSLLPSLHCPAKAQLCSKWTKFAKENKEKSDIMINHIVGHN